MLSISVRLRQAAATGAFSGPLVLVAPNLLGTGSGAVEREFGYEASV